MAICAKVALMRPIEEQVILVTGATDGLGKGVALELARRGATVLIHGRDPARIAATVDHVRSTTKSEKLRGYCGDFSSLEAVRKLATDLLAHEPRLDVLLNNAGIGLDIPGGGVRQTSQDGHELRFAVNYLASFLLTRELLPLVKASAPARIVNVSSIGQEALDFDNVMLERDYSGPRAYRQSKMAQIMFTFDLSEKLAADNVTVNTLHPATFMPTKIVDKPLSPLQDGIDATVHLVTAQTLSETTGCYFDGQTPSQAKPQAYDREARARLWKLSEDLTT